MDTSFEEATWDLHSRRMFLSSRKYQHCVLPQSQSKRQPILVSAAGCSLQLVSRRWHLVRPTPSALLARTPAPTPPTVEICNDGMDSDNNGLIDCGDPAGAKSPDCDGSWSDPSGSANPLCSGLMVGNFCRSTDGAPHYMLIEFLTHPPTKGAQFLCVDRAGKVVELFFRMNVTFLSSDILLQYSI